MALVEKTKYLGVQVDNSLDWKEHIKSVSAKSLNPSSATAALYGDAVALLKSRNFRSFKTEQLGSSIIAALMPLANHLSRI